MHRMFVYGTLKRGQPNHYLITGEQYGMAKYIGQGRTVEKWPLVVATEYNIPFMLDSPGTGKRIYGEIYEIDDATLKEFDALEEHPTCYTRQLINVELGEKRTEDEHTEEGDAADSKQTANEISGDKDPQVVVECQVYMVCHFVDELLELPFKENFDDNEVIGRRYSKGYQTNVDFWPTIKKY